MNIFPKLALILSFAATAVGCRTVSGSSETLYANNATDLVTVKEKTCVNFVKTADCMLRLHGFEADEKESEAFKKEFPKHYQVLADYGSDFESKDDPGITHILETAKKYQLSEGEQLALTTYMGPSFSDINSALRGDFEKWNDYQHVIYSAASALTHLKPLIFKGKVYRSEKTRATSSKKMEGVYTVGNVVIEQPFLSTTSNPTLHFAESDYTSDQILLRYTIDSKSGVKVSDFSPTKSEDEIMFTPGAVFKVVSFSRSVEDVVTDEEKKTIVKADTFNIGLEEIDSI